MPIYRGEPVSYQQDPPVSAEDKVAKDLGMYVARVVVDEAVARYGQGQRT